MKRGDERTRTNKKNKGRNDLYGEKPRWQAVHRIFRQGSVDLTSDTCREEYSMKNLKAGTPQNEAKEKRLVSKVKC